MCAGGGECHSPPVKVREQLCEVSPLLSSGPGDQTQVVRLATASALPDEPSHAPVASNIESSELYAFSFQDIGLSDYWFGSLPYEPPVLQN